MKRAPNHPRNDPRQYDDLADEWLRPEGEFAALHWLAPARARLVPQPTRPGAVLVDLACGGGIMGSHIDGYRHVGVDLTHSALVVARTQGLTPVQADVTTLPLPDESVDVLIAGELLEHLPDHEATVAEMARVLRPGGTVVLDTMADTWWGRLSLVTIGEWLPGGPPRHCHDPALFIGPAQLRMLFARHGVELRTFGIRPAALSYLRFFIQRNRTVRIAVNRWSQAALYQGVGRKRD